jgi:hypothetical protein
MRGAALLERLSAAGAAAQAAVPGLYAWGLTVAPAAWGRGSSALAKVASIAAVLALGAGVAAGPRGGPGVRVASLWGFVLACALAWSAAPAALAPLRIDAPRGLAGMLGWALFAFASAAPALQGRREEGRLAIDSALAPRRSVVRGDATYVAIGVALALALQAIGWSAMTAERALLIRVVALAAGIAVIGAATDIALARHAARAPRSRARRLRGALVVLVVLAFLGMVGLVFVVRG